MAKDTKHTHNQWPPQQWIRLYFSQDMNRCVERANTPLDVIFFTNVTNYIRAYLKDIQIHTTLRQDRLLSQKPLLPDFYMPQQEEKKKPADKDSNIVKRRKEVFAQSLRTQAMLRMYFSVLGSSFQHFSGPGILCNKHFKAYSS